MYKIPALPYSYEKLEPFIDTHTMGLHYQKHQKGYLKKLNDLIHKQNIQEKYPMELLRYHIEEFPKEIREDLLFNLGGVLNHILYFHSISEKKVLPSESLKNKIIDQFQSWENFQKIFKETGVKLKGSGYVYLVMDQEKNLKILPMFNQDCPYFHEQIPLLCLDVWEHAYYINYENNRDLYIDNFFEVIDFSFANKMYQKVLSSKCEQDF